MWSEEDIAGVVSGVSRLSWLVIKRFSAADAPSDILAAFSCLPRSEFEALRRLHFTLDAGTSEFLHEQVPHFMRAMPSTTQHTLEDSFGAPRGRIDWQRTMVRRGQAGNDASHFVSRSLERTSDTVVSRLFSFLVGRIVDTCSWLEKRKLPEVTKLDVSRISEDARRVAAMLRTRGVAPCVKITPRELSPIRKSRRPDVVAALRLYDLYVNLVVNSNENLLKSLLSNRQLAPDNLDDLFEIWTLLVLTENHLSAGWTLKEASLIGGENSPKRPKLTLVKDGSTAELFFQTIPPEMGRTSWYKQIFLEYDLDASMRRPDITVRVKLPHGATQTFIVEVKRTEDKRYILDSVYKTLGYLADFKNALGPDSPLGYLVVWDGIERVPGVTAAAPVRILTAKDLGTLAIPY